MTIDVTKWVLNKNEIARLDGMSVVPVPFIESTDSLIRQLNEIISGRTTYQTYANYRVEIAKIPYHDMICVDVVNPDRHIYRKFSINDPAIPLYLAMANALLMMTRYSHMAFEVSWRKGEPVPVGCCVPVEMVSTTRSDRTIWVMSFGKCLVRVVPPSSHKSYKSYGWTNRSDSHENDCEICVL